MSSVTKHRMLEAIPRSVICSWTQVNASLSQEVQISPKCGNCTNGLELGVNGREGGN